jgi:hypothetical protein
MFFQYQRGGNGPRARSSGASVAPHSPGTGPCRRRTGFGCEPDNYLDQLEQWSGGAEEDYQICGRSSTKPDYDYLEQWDSVVRDDNNDYH